jgi:hypothetical protein
LDPFVFTIGLPRASIIRRCIVCAYNSDATRHSSCAFAFGWVESIDLSWTEYLEKSAVEKLPLVLWLFPCPRPALLHVAYIYSALCDVNMYKSISSGPTHVGYGHPFDGHVFGQYFYRCPFVVRQSVTRHILSMQGIFT